MQIIINLKKDSIAKQCFSYFNCRLLGIIWAYAYISVVLARLPGVREKYLTAKGVRSPKSLGTADLTMEFT